MCIKVWYTSFVCAVDLHCCISMNTHTHTHTIVYFDSVPHTSCCPRYPLDHQTWIWKSITVPKLSPSFSPLSVCVQVYEVTIFEEDDSFDEDTEITEAVSVNTNKITHTFLSHTHTQTCISLTVCVSLTGLLAVCQVWWVEPPSPQKLSSLLDTAPWLAAWRYNQVHLLQSKSPSPKAKQPISCQRNSR